MALYFFSRRTVFAIGKYWLILSSFLLVFGADFGSFVRGIKLSLEGVWQHFWFEAHSLLFAQRRPGLFSNCER